MGRPRGRRKGGVQMERTPRISVVIPTYNRASMACECVASVLAMGWANLEVVVVDDCSPDNTGEILKRAFGHDRRVRCGTLAGILGVWRRR